VDPHADVRAQGLLALNLTPSYSEGVGAQEGEEVLRE
jgi:hypothetical protein